MEIVFISQEDLLAGRWADAIEALAAQPAPPERPAVNGAEVAARGNHRDDGRVIRLARCDSRPIPSLIGGIP